MPSLLALLRPSTLRLSSLLAVMPSRLLYSNLLLFLALLPSAALAQPPSPWNRPESLRALLQSLGVSFDDLTDGASIIPDDHERLLRLLSRLRQIPPSLQDAWKVKPLLPEQILEKTADARGEIFAIEGDLLSVEAVSLDSALAERFDIPALYRLEIASQRDPGQPIEIWTSEIPAAWKNYPDGVATSIYAEALFLRLGESSDALPPLLFIAPKVEWRPHAPTDALAITPSLAALGRAGYDVGTLDAVRQERSKRITAEIALPFLEMLRAQRAFQSGDESVDFPEDAAPLEIAPLLTQPERFVGQAFQFEAVARRIVVVPLDKEEDRRRLGLERYYQIDLVIPKAIRTRVRGDDGVEREVEQNQFPLTICTLEPLAGAELDADIRIPIRVKAFFFKLWAYESKFAESQSSSALQVSPLFIASHVEQVQEPQVESASPVWILGGGLLVIAFVSIWGFLLLRSDDHKERRERSGAHRAPSGAPSASPPNQAD